jgi:hypothetical protein
VSGGLRVHDGLFEDGDGEATFDEAIDLAFADFGDAVGLAFLMQGVARAVPDTARRRRAR